MPDRREISIEFPPPEPDSWLKKFSCNTPTPLEVALSNDTLRIGARDQILPEPPEAPLTWKTAHTRRDLRSFRSYEGVPWSRTRLTPDYMAMVNLALQGARSHSLRASRLERDLLTVYQMLVLRIPTPPPIDETSDADASRFLEIAMAKDQTACAEILGRRPWLIRWRSRAGILHNTDSALSRAIQDLAAVTEGGWQVMQLLPQPALKAAETKPKVLTQNIPGPELMQRSEAMGKVLNDHFSRNAKTSVVERAEAVLGLWLSYPQISVTERPTEGSWSPVPEQLCPARNILDAVTAPSTAPEFLPSFLSRLRAGGLKAEADAITLLAEILKTPGPLPEAALAETFEKLGSDIGGARVTLLCAALERARNARQPLLLLKHLPGLGGYWPTFMQEQIQLDEEFPAPLAAFDTLPWAAIWKTIQNFDRTGGFLSLPSHLSLHKHWFALRACSRSNIMPWVWPSTPNIGMGMGMGPGMGPGMGMGMGRRSGFGRGTGIAAHQAGDLAAGAEWRAQALWNVFRWSGLGSDAAHYEAKPTMNGQPLLTTWASHVLLEPELCRRLVALLKAEPGQGFGVKLALGLLQATDFPAAAAVLKAAAAAPSLTGTTAAQLRELANPPSEKAAPNNRFYPGPQFAPMPLRFLYSMPHRRPFESGFSGAQSFDEADLASCELPWTDLLDAWMKSPVEMLEAQKGKITPKAVGAWSSQLATAAPFPVPNLSAAFDLRKWSTEHPADAWLLDALVQERVFSGVPPGIESCIMQLPVRKSLPSLADTVSTLSDSPLPPRLAIVWLEAPAPKRSQYRQIEPWEHQIQTEAVRLGLMKNEALVTSATPEDLDRLARLVFLPGLDQPDSPPLPQERILAFFKAWVASGKISTQPLTFKTLALLLERGWTDLATLLLPHCDLKNGPLFPASAERQAQAVSSLADLKKRLAKDSKTLAKLAEFKLSETKPDSGGKALDTDPAAWVQARAQAWRTALQQPDAPTALGLVLTEMAATPDCATSGGACSKTYANLRQDWVHHLLAATPEVRAALLDTWKANMADGELIWRLGTPAFWDILWLQALHSNADPTDAQKWLQALPKTWPKLVRDDRWSLDPESFTQKARELHPASADAISQAIKAVLALPECQPSDK